MACLMEELCADSGAPVREVKWVAGSDGWLLVLKAVSRSRGALVCFYGGRTVEDCVEAVVYDLYHKPGLKWKKDRYAK